MEKRIKIINLTKEKDFQTKSASFHKNPISHANNSNEIGQALLTNLIKN
jgi:hypothetical protein